MARVQATYQGNPVGLQRTNAPEQLQQMARVDQSAGRLAEALGVVNSQPYNQLVDNQVKQIHQDALDWSAKTSMSDLKAAVESGKMYPSESPVFAAAASNIYGARAFGELVSQTKSKLETGDLTFKDTKDFENYFLQQRGEMLKGANNFTVSGFDKNFTDVQARLSDMVRSQNDKARVAEAMSQGSQALSLQLAYVTDKKVFTGTPDEAAQVLTNTYKTLIDNKVIPREKGKELLTNLAQSMVPAGQKDVLNAVLDQQVSDGLRVRDIIGENHAQLWRVQAENQHNHLQVKNWGDETKDFTLLADQGLLTGKSLKDFNDTWERYKPYLPASAYLHITNMQEAAQRRLQVQASTEAFNGLVAARTYQIQSETAASLEAGNFSQWKSTANINIPQKDGGQTKYSGLEDDAFNYLNQKHQNSDPTTRMYDFARNGVKDRMLEAQFSKLSNSLTEVTLGTDGKPVQQLDPSVGPMLNVFKQLKDKNAPYLQDLVGNSDTFQRLEMASDMVSMGRSPQEVALGLARMDRIRIGSKDFEKESEHIKKGVAELTNPGFIYKVMQRLPGNDTYADVSNMGQFSAYVRKWAHFNMVTGISGTAEEAVNSAVSHLSKNMVRVNNAMYLASDLPQYPEGTGRNAAQWTEKYISDVLTPVAKKSGYDTTKMRLEPDQGGFIVYINGDTPLVNPDNPQYPLVVSREQMVKWADQTHQTERNNVLTADQFQNAYQNFQKYINAEEDRLSKTMGTYTLERLYPGPGLPNHARRVLIDNPQDFKWLQQNGYDNLPLNEMLDKLKQRRNKK